MVKNLCKEVYKYPILLNTYGIKKTVIKVTEKKIIKKKQAVERIEGPLSARKHN